MFRAAPVHRRALEIAVDMNHEIDGGDVGNEPPTSLDGRCRHGRLVRLLEHRLGNVLASNDPEPPG